MGTAVTTAAPPDPGEPSRRSQAELQRQQQLQQQLQQQQQEQQRKHAQQSENRNHMEPQQQIRVAEPEINSVAAALIEQKHREYNSRCNRYRVLYYMTRLCAGLCAGLLPFFVTTNPPVATGLSIATLCAIVFDQVFNPKEKWVIYSKATDLLMIAKLKASGEYDDYAESLKVLEHVEAQSMAQLSGMADLLKRIEKTRS